MAMPPLARPQVMPGLPKKTAGAPEINAPEIEETTDVRCGISLLLQGGSGAGKSYAIARIIQALAAHDLSTLYIDVENKWQEVARFNPLRIPICKPTIVDGKPRRSTPVERYARLMAVIDGVAAGQYREHKGKRIGAICIDGLMEAGDLIHAKKRAEYTAAKTLQMWGAVGEATIMLAKDLRDAAGIASDELGIPPVNIVATVGEEVDTKIKDKLWYAPLLPGRLSLNRVAYAFNTVFRLTAALTDEGHMYNVHTCAADAWYAKAPAEMFDPVVKGPGADAGGPDIGEMFMKLVDYYGVKED